MCRNNEVFNSIGKIFINRFKLDIEKFVDEDFNEPLLGNRIGLTPRDMLYIFFDIEKEFNIKIPEEDIVDGRFCCINGIIEIINDQLSLTQSA